MKSVKIRKGSEAPPDAAQRSVRGSPWFSFVPGRVPDKHFSQEFRDNFDNVFPPRKLKTGYSRKVYASGV